MGEYLNRLVNGWRASKRKSGVYLFDADYPFYDGPKGKHFVLYTSLKDCIQSDEFGTDDTRLHIGLTPQPYFGDLHRATIFLLMMNPGLSAADYYAERSGLLLSADGFSHRPREENMADPGEMKNKFYAWSNEVFSQSTFDPKSTNLMALVAALTLGSDGAVSYFYFSARKAGVTDAELAAAADIAAAVKGMNLYTLMPKE